MSNADAIDRLRLRSAPRKDMRGVNLISDALLFDRLWYGDPTAVGNATGYATFYSWSHDAGCKNSLVVRVERRLKNLKFLQVTILLP